MADERKGLICAVISKEGAIEEFVVYGSQGSLGTRVHASLVMMMYI